MRPTSKDNEEGREGASTQQFRDPSLAEQQASDSDRGWQHHPKPNNHAISPHINNSKATKLQFFMKQDKYHIKNKPENCQAILST